MIKAARMVIPSKAERFLFICFLCVSLFCLSTCIHKEYLRDLAALLEDPDRYDRNLYAPTVNNSAIRVDVNIDVEDLRDISELTMTFRTEIYFSQIWHDPRLFINETYIDLDFVTLHPDYVEQFWKPDTIFSNVLSSTSPPKDDDSFTHKNYLAVNGKGDVYFSQRLSLTAACWMPLEKYPFDHQLCRLSFESYGIVKKNLEYKWNKVKSVTVEDINLPDFRLINVTTSESISIYDENVYSRLKLCFFLERKTSFYFLELYIPAILIVISAWLATVGNTSSFSDILSVLLSQLFLYFSYITVMPKVSDVKAMDVFLIGCFAFIFFALLQTFINTEENLLNETKNQKVEQPLDFNTKNIAKVHPKYSDSTPDDQSVQNLKIKKRKIPKIHFNFLQNVFKYINLQNFFTYAIYPTSFFIFCFFYFITYMHFLHRDNVPEDC